MFTHAYQQCSEHLTSIYANNLLNQIRNEIFTKLPILDEREQNKRAKLQSDKTKSSFYSSLKQKYSNFIELQYLPDELIHDLYNALYCWQENKHYLKNSKFKFNIFLYKIIDRSVPMSFPQIIQDKFQNKKSTTLQTSSNSFWLNAAFDCRNENISNFIKYHKQLASNTNSLIITIGLIYDKIADDIFALLSRNLHINRVILKVEQKAFWVGENVEQMPFFEDTEWFNEMNMIMNVLFGCLYKLEQLKALSIVCDLKCNFLLYKENCDILSMLINKHRYSLEVITFSRIEIEQSCQMEIIESIKQCKEMKIVIFKSAKFIEDVCKKCLEVFNSELYKEDYIYLRLNKGCIVINNVYEEIKDK